MPRTITDPDVRALHEQWMADQPYAHWGPEERAELRVAAEQEVARRRAVAAERLVTAEEWLAAHQRSTA